MPDDERPSHDRAHPLADAVNRLIARLTELTDREEPDTWSLEQLHDLRERIVEPVCRALRGTLGRPRDADLLLALFQAAEEHVVCFPGEPARREERRSRVEALKLQARRRLLGGRDVEREVDRLLDDVRRWQWRTTVDEHGRIAFATGSGAAVPARSDIIREVGPQIIDQAIRGQRPYAEEARPRDSGGEPGGLVAVRGARRLLVVGDLHGRYDNLEMILRDRENLRDVIDGGAHLVFTGDAVHPRSSRTNDDEAYEESFGLMLLIMTLKAENPFNVHYLVGNHDNAHVGGSGVGRGAVHQGRAFERFILDKFPRSVFEGYCHFVLTCPAAVLARAADGALLVVHASTSARVMNVRQLVDIFTRGRRDGALKDLLWCRDFDAERIARDAARLGAKFVLGGHTVPTRRNARRYGFEPIAPPAFGKVGRVQLILNAQCDVFGYVDVDLAAPLPEDVAELRAPDGRHACRLLCSKNARPADDGR